MQRPAKPWTPVRFRPQPPLPPRDRPAAIPEAEAITVNGLHQMQPTLPARVAELVDARDLKSLDFGHAGSSPAPGTTNRNKGLRLSVTPFLFSATFPWRTGGALAHNEAQQMRYGGPNEPQASRPSSG